MVDDLPQLVAQVAQYVESRLEGTVDVAERGLCGVLAEVVQQPLPEVAGTGEDPAAVRP
ncbi:hypothetical protein ACRJ4B_51365 [Streptomyces sp. GTA36]